MGIFDKVTAEDFGKGTKTLGDQISKGFGSFTGSTAARHKREQEQKKIDEGITAPAQDLQDKASGLGAALAENTREIAPMESLNISRGDVQDVSVDPVTGARIQTAPQDQFRAQQTALGQQLASRAAGQGVSPAQLQLQQATDRNIAQQAAARAGLTGSGAALGRREAGRLGSQLAQQGAAAGAVLRSQETVQAQQQLGQLAGQARGQDIGLATGQAGLEQQAAIASQDATLRANLANQGVDLAVLKDNAARGDAAAMATLQSQLQQLGMSDEMIRAYMAQELGALGVQAGGVTAGIGAGQAAQASQDKQSGAGTSAIASLGAAAIAASDENLKEDITSGDESLGEFLGNLNVHDYKYKDSKFGAGNQTSVMAQELEKSEIGKKAVINTTEGKMVDYAKLLPAMLAANANSHKRIMTLEGALKSKKRK